MDFIKHACTCIDKMPSFCSVRTLKRRLKALKIKRHLPVLQREIVNAVSVSAFIYSYETRRRFEFLC